MIILKDGDKIPEGVAFISTGPDGITRCFFQNDDEVIQQRDLGKNITLSNNRSKSKDKRSQRIKQNTITTRAGNMYNACEDSQNRMMRRILTMSDTDTITWVMADNITEVINKAELMEALKLAVDAQSTQWEL